MKVVFDHQIFGWQKYGGISRYFCALASAMQNSSEISLEILAPRFVTKYIRDLDTLQVNGRFLSERNLHPRILRMQNYILSQMIIKKLQPNIVHETYYSMFGYRGCKNTRTVLTVYDLIHERFPSYFSRLDPTIIEKKNALRRADHIIAISNNTKSDLMEYYDIPPAKITVTHLGFELPKVKSKQDNESKRKPFVLFVGNRSGHKNFERLLLAFSNSNLLKDCYQLICFGGGEFRKSECSYFKKLDLNAKHVIQMTGGDRELSELYRSASAFIYPSVYEGFGIPPLEAMSYGCPVICSNSSSIPEVVGDAGRYFDPLDPIDMMNAIERVLFDNDLRNKLTFRGYKRLAHFSWDKCASETLEVYKNLLK